MVLSASAGTSIRKKALFLLVGMFLGLPHLILLNVVAAPLLPICPHSQNPPFQIALIRKTHSTKRHPRLVFSFLNAFLFLFSSSFLFSFVLFGIAFFSIDFLRVG